MNNTIKTLHLPDYTTKIPAARQYSVLIALSLISFGIAFYISIVPFNIVIAHIGLISMGLFSIIHVVRSIISREKTGTQEQIKANRQILSALDFQGDELVLDIGCKSGLIAHSIARKLITGKVIGSNFFNSGDIKAENDIFHSNARAAGVSYKVSYDEKSAECLAFKDNSFDVVISALNCSHLGKNICTFRKMKEAVRVLNPKGLMAVYDEPLVIDLCHEMFTKEGFQIISHSKNFLVCRKPD